MGMKDNFIDSIIDFNVMGTVGTPRDLYLLDDASDGVCGLHRGSKEHRFERKPDTKTMPPSPLNFYSIYQGAP